MSRIPLAALLVPILFLAPSAVAHTATTTESFASPTYSVVTASGPTGTPCETFEEKEVFQSWALPPSPPGPGAGPSHAMHTSGTAPGATGWHQVYAMRITRHLRTDLPTAPGTCVLAVPWVSELQVKWLAVGGGTLANPADVIDVTLSGQAGSLQDFAAQSGATLSGQCAGVGGSALLVGSTCTLPAFPAKGGFTYDFTFAAWATNPTQTVPAPAFGSITGTFGFATSPTPGTGTPGGPHLDRVQPTLSF